MIHLFQSKGRIVFFPKKWGNSVSAWILGLHSPSGTIKLANTADPATGKGAAIDVDVEVVCNGVKRRLKDHFTTADDVKNALGKFLDNASLVQRDGKATVSEEWLKARLAQAEEAEDTTTPSVIPSGGAIMCSASQLTQADATTWARGNTGFELYVACRSCEDGAEGVTVFRKLSVDKYGKIKAVSAEDGDNAVPFVSGV